MRPPARRKELENCRLAGAFYAFDQRGQLKELEGELYATLAHLAARGHVADALPCAARPRAARKTTVNAKLDGR
jgi:hypothetical protein